MDTEELPGAPVRLSFTGDPGHRFALPAAAARRVRVRAEADGVDDREAAERLAADGTLWSPDDYPDEDACASYALPVDDFLDDDGRTATVRLTYGMRQAAVAAAAAVPPPGPTARDTPGSHPEIVEQHARERDRLVDALAGAEPVGGGSWAVRLDYDDLDALGHALAELAARQETPLVDDFQGTHDEARMYPPWHRSVRDAVTCHPTARTVDGVERMWATDPRTGTDEWSRRPPASATADVHKAASAVRAAHLRTSTGPADPGTPAYTFTTRDGTGTVRTGARPPVHRAPDVFPDPGLLAATGWHRFVDGGPRSRVAVRAGDDGGTVVLTQVDAEPYDHRPPVARMAASGYDREAFAWATDSARENGYDDPAPTLEGEHRGIARPSEGIAVV